MNVLCVESVPLILLVVLVKIVLFVARNVWRDTKMMTANNTLIKIAFLILFFVIIIYLFSPKKGDKK